MSSSASPPLSLSSSSKAKIDSILKAAVNPLGGPTDVPPYFFKALTAEGELYSKGEGEVQDGKTITGDIVLRIFSNTKLVTSIAALQLIERGLVSLDTEVGSILPGLRQPKILTGYSEGGEPQFVDAKNKVTLRHLLNHSSGLSLAWFSPDLLRYATDLVNNGASEEERHYNQPLLFEPGTQFRYSPGTDYVGRLVEIITGLTLEDYLQQNIFHPLGMTSTSFILSPALKSRSTFPIAYRVPSTGQLLPSPPAGALPPFLVDLPDNPSPWFMGAWGLHSTFDDYAKLLQHLLQLGQQEKKQPDAKAIISEQSLKSLFTGTLEKEAKPGLELFKKSVKEVEGLDWSTGWCVVEEDWPGRRRKGSGFWDGLAHTEAMVDPASGIAIVGGTQLFDGPGDMATRNVWADLERAVYAGLE